MNGRELPNTFALEYASNDQEHLLALIIEDLVALQRHDGESVVSIQSITFTYESDEEWMVCSHLTREIAIVLYDRELA